MITRSPRFMLLALALGMRTVAAQGPQAQLTPAEARDCGRAFRDTMVSVYGRIDDANWNRFLGQIVERLRRATALPGLQIDATIIGDTTVNAASLPGGFVLVNVGLLRYASDLAKVDAQALQAKAVHEETLAKAAPDRPVLHAGPFGRRGPIPGLYMCGSGTHPGGGVTGLPGHNAAREILRDLKRRYDAEFWPALEKLLFDRKYKEALTHCGKFMNDPEMVSVKDRVARNNRPVMWMTPALITGWMNTQGGATRPAWLDDPLLTSAYSRPDIENYGLNATYSMTEIATGKMVVAGQTFARVSYDIPGQEQRFARLRGLRDAESRAAKVIADNIRNRLASYFIAGT